MSIQTCDYTVKVIFIGDTNTGKTSVLHKIQNPGQNAISVERTSTIGVEFGAFVKNFDNKIIKYNIWDTAGQEKFRSITTSFYKNAAIAILFCDLTQYSTYKSLRTWLKDIETFAPETVSILLVGNKSDLVNKREVDQHIIHNFARNYNLQYIEISVVTGERVDDILNTAMIDVFKKYNTGQQINGLRIQESIEVKTGSTLCKNCTIS